jgi:pimeloyl-ACP methyl ester carboxylesterase
MRDLASDAILILDGYGIKKAHFIGDSMGGWICQWVGVDYPQRILSLVIISAGPIEIAQEGLMNLTAEEQKILDTMSKMFLLVKEGKTLEETVTNFLPVWKHSNAEIPFDEDMAKEYTIDLFTRTKNKYITNHDLMMKDFLLHMKPLGVLQKIVSPTLIIHGDKDPVVLLRHGKAVADAIANSKFITIDGMGHVFFNRDLEAKIAQLVIEYLNNETK